MNNTTMLQTAMESQIITPITASGGNTPKPYDNLIKGMQGEQDSMASIEDLNWVQLNASKVASLATLSKEARSNIVTTLEELAINVEDIIYNDETVANLGSFDQDSGNFVDEMIYSPTIAHVETQLDNLKKLITIIA